MLTQVFSCDPNDRKQKGCGYIGLYDVSVNTQKLKPLLKCPSCGRKRPWKDTGRRFLLDLPTIAEESTP